MLLCIIYYYYKIIIVLFITIIKTYFIIIIIIMYYIFLRGGGGVLVQFDVMCNFYKRILKWWKELMKMMQRQYDDDINWFSPKQIKK